MPGFTTHYLFGKNTKEEIDNKDILTIINKYEKSFNIGLQGPDIFFYYVPAHLDSNRNIGNVMHDTTTHEYFQNLISARNELSSPEQQEMADAYILGFIGHYSLDTICHPYIYHKSNYMENKDAKLKDFGNHVSLETDIDKTMLRTYLDKKPTDFSPGETIDIGSNELKVISNVIYQAIHKTYPDHFISAMRIRNSIRSMRIENNWMKDKSGTKKKIMRSFEQLFFKHSFLSSMVPSDTITLYDDCCNEKHNDWYNPWDEEKIRNENFFDLVDIAAKNFLRRIGLYGDMISAHPDAITNVKIDPSSVDALLSDLGNLSYLSGLPL
ncbi:MAG: zinc dependent phospholipase C family protein [Lachnospiraceae bacterium]|nr:zinc dependent phospholipase C family protein [Lachnospiraceae bacterium]